MGGLYRYEELDRSSTGVPKEFRILTVLGGTGELRCRITKYPLPEARDEASVSYEALSWTWGEEDTLEDLTIIVDKPRQFAVKPYLKAALTHLRHPAADRNLWVDYICTNQSDNAERAASVKLMDIIYSKAHNVCIWLGQHMNNSDIAFKFVKEQVNDLGNWEEITEEHTKEQWSALAALMDRKWFTRRWVVQELALARKATVHCSDEDMTWEQFETAVSLFDRDAPRLAGYYKGSKAAKFDHNFFGDVGQMGATKLVHLKSNLFRLDENHQIAEYRSNLNELVSNLWSFEAQDPHDMIYAILSLARDTHDKMDIAPQHRESDTGEERAENSPRVNGVPLSPLHPDASPKHQLDERGKKRAQSVLSAFQHARANRTMFQIDYAQDFFLLCEQFLSYTIPSTEYGHNLDILLRPWAPMRCRAGNRILLPSWIPSIERAAFKRQPAKHAPGGYQMIRKNGDPLVGQETRGTRSSFYNASRARRAERHEWKIDIPNRHLHVTGFVLDSIDQIQDACYSGNIAADWLHLGGYADEIKKNKQNLDALWRTLVADRGRDGTNTLPYYKRAFEQAVHDSAEGINTDLLKGRGHPILLEFLKRVEGIATNRRLFKSRMRHDLGLAPKLAKNGDYICIVRGMSVPVILRPVEDTHPIEYTLIGECYLHTMMDGRAVDVQEQRSDELEILREELVREIEQADAVAMQQDLADLHANRVKELLQKLVLENPDLNLKDVVLPQRPPDTALREMRKNLRELERESELLSSQTFVLR